MVYIANKKSEIPAVSIKAPMPAIKVKAGVSVAAKDTAPVKEGSRVKK